jgi:hypothetical protein
MATTLTGNASIAGVWALTTPIVVRAFGAFHTAAGVAGTLSVRDGDNLTDRWQIRTNGAINDRVFNEFPGTGVHCSGLSIDIGAATQITWWIQYDNP